MTIKNDRWIRHMISRGMINNAIPQKEREAYIKPGHCIKSIPALSYGVSSYGYDMRLSPKDFRVFRPLVKNPLLRLLWRLVGKNPDGRIDPKSFDAEAYLETAKLHSDGTGDYFLLPPQSYALGVSIERFKIPENCSVICQGKSTYARVGVIVPPTPLEAGWIGNVTLEIINYSRSEMKIYAGEGIVQGVFFEGEPCEDAYQSKGYQGQKEEVTIAKV